MATEYHNEPKIENALSASVIPGLFFDVAVQVKGFIIVRVTKRGRMH